MGILRNSEDLDVALEHGEESLLRRMGERLSAGLDKPWVITASFRGHGATQEQVLRETGHRLLAGAFPELIQRIRKEVTDRHGRAPIGYLRVRIYLDGDSQNALLEFGRNIEPQLDVTASGDPNIGMLQQENARLQARVLALEAKDDRNSTLLANIAVSAHSSTATMSTMRGPAAAAADLGSMWSLLAFAVLVLFGRGAIARAVGLPADAGLDEIGARLQARVLLALVKEPMPTEVLRKPADASAAAEKAITPEKVELPSHEELIERMRAEPAYLTELKRKVMADPELMNTFMEA